MDGNRNKCHYCDAIRVDGQLGLERTPDEYVAKMVEGFREVRRVLRNDGTCWINLARVTRVHGLVSVEASDWAMKECSADGWRKAEREGSSAVSLGR
jgi:hypothetical protein